MYILELVSWSHVCFLLPPRDKISRTPSTQTHYSTLNTSALLLQQPPETLGHPWGLFISFQQPSLLWLRVKFSHPSLLLLTKLSRLIMGNCSVNPPCVQPVIRYKPSAQVLQEQNSPKFSKKNHMYFSCHSHFAPVL